MIKAVALVAGALALGGLDALGALDALGDAGGGLSANPRRHFRNWASPWRWAIIFFDRPVKAPYIRSLSRHDLWIDTQSESKGANTNHAVVMARVSHDV